MQGEEDKFKEECGIFGIFAPQKDVARLTYYGLYALQHRGQESAGITVSSGDSIRIYKGMGLVPEVFNDQTVRDLTGHIAIGHVRYLTTGSSQLLNTQPLVTEDAMAMVALAHNGNLINASVLRFFCG